MFVAGSWMLSDDSVRIEQPIYGGRDKMEKTCDSFDPLPSSHLVICAIITPSSLYRR